MPAALPVIRNVQKLFPLSAAFSQQEKFAAERFRHAQLRAVKPLTGAHGMIPFAFGDRQGAAVQVAVEHEMHTGQKGFRKAVTDFLSCRNLTGGLGALRMVDFMRPVLAVSDGVIRSKEGGVPADFGDLSGPGGQEAVLVQKQRLYLLHVLQIDFMRADAVSDCHSRGFADGFPKQRAGCHNPDAAHGHMGHADIPSGKKQIFHVFGVERPVGNGVGSGCGNIGVWRSSVPEAAGKMVVQLPASIGDLILKYPAIGNVSLRDHVFSAHPSGFPFSGQKSQKVQIPSSGVKFSGILDVVPGSCGQADQLIPQHFRIRNGIPVSAQLQIPEIFIIAVKIRIPVLEVLPRELFAPFRRNVFNFPVCLPSLDQAGHSHGHAVAGVDGGILFKFRAGFPSHPEMSAAQRGQNAVSGAVAVKGGFHLIKALGCHLISGDGTDPFCPAMGERPSLYSRVHAGAV